jgi:hypothetical protein
MSVQSVSVVVRWFYVLCALGSSVKVVQKTDVG